MKKIGKRSGISIFESTKKCSICSKSLVGRKADLKTMIFCSNRCQTFKNIKKIPENLEDLYLEKKFSINKISEIFSVSDTTVKKWLQFKKIKLRNMGESISLSQIGKIHSIEWNENIRKGHLKYGKHHHLAGENNPMFSKPFNPRQFKLIHGGFREDIGIYVRSSWEANYFRFLRYQQEKNLILGFSYEKDTFYFEDGSSPHSYRPDFKIFLCDGTEKFIEIKGRETQKDIIRLDKFKKFFPFHILEILRYREYMELERGYRKLIPTWEKIIPPSKQALRNKTKLKKTI